MTEKNKVQFGLSNVHIAKLIEEDGQITYGTPFALPGAVSLSTDPEGETVAFYADNIKYYVSTNNNGYTGDLEVAKINEQFLTEILGQNKDSNGAIIETSDDINSRFALMFEGKGDASGRRFIYYDCTVARPGTEMNTTEESAEPQTDTLSITMAPRKTDNVVKAVIEPTEENKSIYDAFFTKVYEKDASAVI